MSRESMQVVILAGGLATRLGPLAADNPKSLIEISGKPFLRYQLSWLADQGLNDVVLCVGHMADKIMAYAGDGREFGQRIRYSVEEGELLGTAGALKKAEPLLDEAFCILNGDSYLPVNPQEPIQRFRQKGFTALMLTFENHDQYDKSNIIVQDGRVTVYDRQKSKAGMESIDYGLQIFRREVLGLIPANCFINLDYLYQKLIEQGELAAFEVNEPFYEIGSTPGLERFKQYIEKRGLHKK
jgi:NDP-sugar pyrophosphorylase family protein